MSEDQIIPLVASSCLLLWLLAREPRIDARLRFWLNRAAHALLTLGGLVAAWLVLRWLLGG